MNMAHENCDICGKAIVPSEHGGSGYGTNAEHTSTVCYACCGELDRETLRNLPLGGKFTAYLTGDNLPSGRSRWDTRAGWHDGTWYVGNWPDSAKWAVRSVKASWHNMSGTRLDFWLKIEGNYFHGVKVMTFGDVCTLTRVKSWDRQEE
jgi:hypothetical protein